MATDASSAGSSPAVLFTDLFSVESLNAEGKRFDRVDRIAAVATTSETSLKLDLACEVFALAPGERFTLALASSLRLDGKPDADYWEPDGKPTLLDQYDYGMAGKVFKYEYMGDRRVAIVASFGGLLMLLIGDQRHLIRLSLDQKIYALLRKNVGSSAGR